MRIRIRDRSIPEFTSEDFVRYFLRKYKDEYGTSYEIINKFTSRKIMRKLITSFLMDGSPKQKIIEYICWAINERVSKEKGIDMSDLLYMLNKYKGVQSLKKKNNTSSDEFEKLRDKERNS